MAFRLKSAVIAESYPDGKPVPNDQRIIQEIRTLWEQSKRELEDVKDHVSRAYWFGRLDALELAHSYATHPNA